MWHRQRFASFAIEVDYQVYLFLFTKQQSFHHLQRFERLSPNESTHDKLRVFNCNHQ